MKTNENAEKEMNAKILQITLFIGEKYPELAVFIEEMPICIPNEKKPKVNVNALLTYYNSLQEMLTKYTLGLPYMIH